MPSSSRNLMPYYEKKERKGKSGEKRKEEKEEDEEGEGIEEDEEEEEKEEEEEILTAECSSQIVFNNTVSGRNTANKFTGVTFKNSVRKTDSWHRHTARHNRPHRSDRRNSCHRPDTRSVRRQPGRPDDELG